MKRVLIADDHPVARIGVACLISNAGFKVVGQAADPVEVEALLATMPCELLVTDLSMPNSLRPDGVRMIEGIRRSYPDLPILVLTAFGNLELLRAVIKAGVAGVVEKCSGADALLEAVSQVLGGRGYLSEPLAHRLSSSLQTEVLSARESEVVRLLAHGLCAKEIADIHRRTLSTISRQKGAAMRRLGLRSDYELLEYAKAAGLAPGGT